MFFILGHIMFHKSLFYNTDLQILSILFLKLDLHNDIVFKKKKKKAKPFSLYMQNPSYLLGIHSYTFLFFF